MRHLMTSYLALHWAVVFALLAFVCIGGVAGLEGVLSTFGALRGGPDLGRLDRVLVTAPLASAFLMVAALFCWALIETFLGESPDSAEPIFKIGFVAAGCVFAVVLVLGTAQGIGGLFLPATVHLAALAVSYLVVIGERLPYAPARLPPAPAKGAARAMAANAAHASLLSRISGRRGTGAKS